jgi:hypothetical protein
MEVNLIPMSLEIILMVTEVIEEIEVVVGVVANLLYLPLG